MITSNDQRKLLFPFLELLSQIDYTIFHLKMEIERSDEAYEPEAFSLEGLPANIEFNNKMALIHALRSKVTTCREIVFKYIYNHSDTMELEVSLKQINEWINNAYAELKTIAVPPRW